jgi:hypothetical protein
MIKAMKAVAEFSVYTATTMMSLAVIGGIVIYVSRHVTCINLLDKVCFVY